MGLLTGLLIDVVNKQTNPLYIHPAQSRASHVRVAPLYASRRIGLQLAATYQPCLCRRNYENVPNLSNVSNDPNAERSERSKN
jgi:hypothetical protein